MKPILPFPFLAPFSFLDLVLLSFLSWPPRAQTSSLWFPPFLRMVIASSFFPAQTTDGRTLPQFLFNFFKARGPSFERGGRNTSFPPHLLYFPLGNNCPIKILGVLGGGEWVCHALTRILEREKIVDVLSPWRESCLSLYLLHYCHSWVMMPTAAAAKAAK